MQLIGFVGSLSSVSLNKKVMEKIGTLLPPEVILEILEIEALPLFNRDLETDGYSPHAASLKEKIRTAEGIIIATPEYNRTIPAALKNMMEWTTRPSGDNAWMGKKVFICGASSGNISTALAQYDLKRMMLYLNASVMGQPEVMIAKGQEKFDEQGAVIDPQLKELLEKAVRNFLEFVSK